MRSDLTGMGVRGRRSGREYVVSGSFSPFDQVWLFPLGDDVRPAQERGRFNGGARAKRISTERLLGILRGECDPSYEPM